MQNHFKTFQIISKSQLNKRCGVSWKPNHMPQLKLTPDILAAAVIGFEAQKVAIEGKIAEIRLMLDGDRSEASAPAEIREPRKKRSAAVSHACGSRFWSQKTSGISSAAFRCGRFSGGPDRKVLSGVESARVRRRWPSGVRIRVECLAPSNERSRVFELHSRHGSDQWSASKEIMIL